ncbi:hypothetical protein MLD38_027375 [Melastoma candidum]|uniref:Uncharacterized protein n=1 Tax=Melastoma candidum TaxID=119954 RepID=A0ACB9P2I8_9MYRT|nr:hypothetical protein MLD38_027375 [Melastoma candidum]
MEGVLVRTTPDVWKYGLLKGCYGEQMHLFKDNHSVLRVSRRVRVRSITCRDAFQKGFAVSTTKNHSGKPFTKAGAVLTPVSDPAAIAKKVCADDFFFFGRLCR